MDKYHRILKSGKCEDTIIQYKIVHAENVAHRGYNLNLLHFLILKW
jgi:hypothetical protein